MKTQILLNKILAFFLISLFFLFFIASTVKLSAQDPMPTPIPCPDQLDQTGHACNTELNEIYPQLDTGPQGAKDDLCTTNYATFQSDPRHYHYWIEDPEITAQGKANERARQFVFWVTTHAGIDNSPILTKIWGTTRNLSYFLVIIIAAILGLGIIIGQRTDFETGIKFWPAITKILLLLLYITFSATIVITIVQLSELLMKFFIENLAGKDLFNIYFSSISTEGNYVNFVGCRDLNVRIQEAVKTEMMMLKLTNLSHYFMGCMLLLRKIILWFLLFVSPFLALLMPFVFIRNIGWIWIGVFFQWVFYGPLLALFLGAMALIWKFGIPFIFDFSRVNTAAGYIYHTGINILYGGPAQKLEIANNGNYIDTYAEYIITLLMLWAVTIFPWWLLRIFRDYCCEGINAMKNMMLSNLGSGFPGGPTPSPVPPTNIPTSTVGGEMKIPKEMETMFKTRIETIEEIKKAKTEDISRSLNIKVSNLTDIARLETNRTLNETTNKNINYLRNPIQASTLAERQKYMNIRSELSSRAAKSDFVARQVINVLTTSKAGQSQVRQNIITSLPKLIPVTQVVSFKVKLPQEKVQQISSVITNSVINNKSAIDTISKKVGVAPERTAQVINMLHRNINTPAAEIVQKISTDTNTDKEKVSSVIKEFSNQVKSDTKIIEAVAKENNLNSEQVNKVMDQYKIVTEPEKNIEQTIIVPKTVSIDEYEQVKKMWTHQYEKSEVPMTENIKTRNAWVDQDIVIITNTLNKLLSSQEEIRQQGLDDVGYILPIFLVNNLTGEQLVAYLKAKIEAARTVKNILDQEKEVIERLKSKSVETVDVLKPKKKEAEKTMEMKAELNRTK